MFQRKNPLEIEWQKLEKKEQKFLEGRAQKKDSLINQKLAEKVPAKLQETLSKAFSKAFGMIFEKGSVVIEKTFKKEELEKSYKINEYTDEIRQSRKSLKAFGKKADGSGKLNMAVSGAAGVGMGLLGIGIPDIPVFTGFILKSIYEIALNYGFSYETIEERRFILLIIEGAVAYGPEMVAIDEEIEQLIANKELSEGYDEKIQIEKAAAGLSKELLYMKFLQGIPIIGAVGGIYDAVYMKRITEYANLKYKKRFLVNKKKKEGQSW